MYNNNNNNFHGDNFIPLQPMYIIKWNNNNKKEIEMNTKKNSKDQGREFMAWKFWLLNNCNWKFFCFYIFFFFTLHQNDYGYDFSIDVNGWIRENKPTKKTKNKEIYKFLCLYTKCMFEFCYWNYISFYYNNNNNNSYIEFELPFFFIFIIIIVVFVVWNFISFFIYQQKQNTMTIEIVYFIPFWTFSVYFEVLFLFWLE